MCSAPSRPRGVCGPALRRIITVLSMRHAGRNWLGHRAFGLLGPPGRAEIADGRASVDAPGATVRGRVTGGRPGAGASRSDPRRAVRTDGDERRRSPLHVGVTAPARGAPDHAAGRAIVAEETSAAGATMRRRAAAGPRPRAPNATAMLRPVLGISEPDLE